MPKYFPLASPVSFGSQRNWPGEMVKAIFSAAALAMLCGCGVVDSGSAEKNSAESSAPRVEIEIGSAQFKPTVPVGVPLPPEASTSADDAILNAIRGNKLIVEDRTRLMMDERASEQFYCSGRWEALMSGGEYHVIAGSLCVTNSSNTFCRSVKTEGVGRLSLGTYGGPDKKVYRRRYLIERLEACPAMR